MAILGFNFECLGKFFKVKDSQGFSSKVKPYWSYFIRSCIFKIRGTWYHLDSHYKCLVYTTSMFNTSN